MTTTTETLIIKPPKLFKVFLPIGMICCLPTIYNSIIDWQHADRHPHYFIAIRVFSVIAFLLFTAGFLFMFYMLVRKNKGIIINDEGIEDYFTLNRVGLIPWKNINKIEVKKFWLNKIILVFIDNPQELIYQQTGFRRYNLRNIYKRFQTPIVLSINQFDPKFTEYSALLSERLKQKHAQY